MFVEQLRRAVEASPRCELPKLGEVLWKAWSQGLVDDDEAQTLSDMIEGRKAIPVPPPRPRLRVGSRPRSSESLGRRRRWAASGWMPPAIVARFTTAETAVLSAVAAEVRRHGACTLTVGHIAALAGVCGQTVRNALKAAQALDLAHVEQRRVACFRNKPNRVTIISREWLSWIRLRRTGSKSVEPTNTTYKNQRSHTAEPAWAAEGQHDEPVRHRGKSQLLSRRKGQSPSHRRGFG
jgi:hypothetical protein